MITFEQARRSVEHLMRFDWQPDHGTLITLPTGFEDAGHWRVVAGAREYLVDRDVDFNLMDVPAFLVSKSTGAITQLSVVDNFDQLDGMTPTT